MSGSLMCNCGERLISLEERNWVIQDYKCNYSAFNGYRRTPSDYSCILCKTCGRSWRTKAKYVEKLREIEGRKWKDRTTSLVA